MSSNDPLHEEIESLLGAYALDAVDPEEAFIIERHLLECPRCRAEVEAHSEVASALGSSVEALPEGLWDVIAGRLNSADRQSLKKTGEPTLGISAGEARGGPVKISRAADRRPNVSHRRVFQAAEAAIGVAAVAAIAVLGVNLSRSDGQVRQLTSAIRGRADAAAVAAALQVPGHRLVNLRTSEGVQAAQFVVLPDGRGYLVSSHLPALPADETYQLWAMISAQPISVGLLGNQPSRAAFTVAKNTSPTQLEMTIEPAGGVTTPDRAAVAVGTFTRA